MTVLYKNTNFSYLDNVDIDGQTYILGSNEVLCNLVDLCTYGWKFFPDITFEPLEYLPEGQQPEDLTTAETIRRTLFPTLSEEKPGGKHYFGSITSGSQVLYMISVPRGSKKVIFKEGGKSKIEVDMEEPKDETLLWFVISKGALVSDINLSYYSWLRSQLPHRNYQQHVVGPDYHIEVVEEEGGYWFDKTSGTILANSDSKPTPLLDALKKKAEVDGDKWSPRVHYHKGAVVTYHGKWVALKDNVGECPVYSSSWIARGIIQLFHKSISVISCTSGEVTPNVTTVSSMEGIIDLDSIRLDYGYVLRGHLKGSYNAYIDKTYTLTNIKDVECTKLKGAFIVPVDKIEPLVEVYINDGEVKWPRKSFDSTEIMEMRVSLGGSFKTNSQLSTANNIGEITKITKTYIGDNDEVLGIDSKVDSLVIGEATTPILSDTVTLPCRKVRYDISLTYYAVQLKINEHPGFYVNSVMQTSETNETKHFYFKPVNSSEDTCCVDIYLGDTKHTTIKARPGQIKETITMGNFSDEIVIEKKESGVFDLSIKNPAVNINFNVYGN